MQGGRPGRLTLIGSIFQREPTWSRRGGAALGSLWEQPGQVQTPHKKAALSGSPLSCRAWMATQSQCLEDAPLRGCSSAAPQYSEAQRLALEELLSGGPPALRSFLRREKMRPFLSEPEIHSILKAALPPPPRDDDQKPVAKRDSMSLSGTNTLDGSSGTYFPVQSDLEPPLLELGWPAFASGAFRGLTRVETHFQPSFGDSVYPCKDAVRSQIRSAREVGPLSSFPGRVLFF